MRVILVASLILALCRLYLQGTDAAKISFSTKDATSTKYYEFMKALRGNLTIRSTKFYDIPLLHSSVSNASQRFSLIDLSNNDGRNNITVAIDVVNVSVVAYRARNKSFFLKDAPDEAVGIWSNTTRAFFLPFSSNYTELEKAADITRQNLLLGKEPLHNAVNSLWGRDTKVAQSFLVIIQMLSEAAKFRSIEQRVRTSLHDQTSFLPDVAMLSLVKNWAAFSLEIQRSVNGVFSNSIQLRSSNNVAVSVDSVRSSIIITVALLADQCSNQNGNLIKMPVGDDGNGICDFQERTTRISGRDGKCADVTYARTQDGTPVWLYDCGQQINQKWTFYSDGTIRSMGKCLTSPSTTSSSAVVTIYNCTTASAADTKWELSRDGTITHHRSKLALTAPTGVTGTNLTFESNNNTAGQSWRAGDDVLPTVTFIVGYNDTCLTANSDKTRIWMEYCVSGQINQNWALYSDGTVRLNSDRSLCVTSDGQEEFDPIVLLKCQGTGNQRWVFRHDGTLLNPSSGLYMDVEKNDLYRRSIILYHYKGQPNQQWLPFF